MNKFEQLGLSESLLKAILDLGESDRSTGESDSIIEKDTDMVALAQTGTGKRHLISSYSEN
jgi:ATP-dependent RNA helicase DeaD